MQYVGAIVAAWSTYGTFKLSSDWSWRIPSLLQAAVSIIQLLLIYFVPESPRWLIANGRTPEATKILCKYHSGTEEPTELVLLQVAQIAGAIEFERSSESVSYLQFFRTSKSHIFPIHVSEIILKPILHSQRETAIDCSLLLALASSFSGAATSSSRHISLLFSPISASPTLKPRTSSMAACSSSTMPWLVVRLFLSSAWAGGSCCLRPTSACYSPSLFGLSLQLATSRQREAIRASALE